MTIPKSLLFEANIKFLQQSTETHLYLVTVHKDSGENLRGVLVGKKVPDRFEPLPIRILFLSHNDISSLEPQVFQHMQYLRDLHLDNNPLVIDENFSAALRHLRELKILNLAATGLTSLPKDAFVGIQVTSLLLNNNQFTQVPDLRSLEGSLRLLNINQNPIAELDNSSFSGLQNLIEVVASGLPDLKAIRADTFSNLENIRVISCSYNPVLTDIDENAFWHHKTTKRSKLQEVYLNDNALPRIRKNLLPWVRTKKVTLDGNRWVCDCQLHWLATLLHSRNNTIDRITEIKCWEPGWLNGTQMLFWNIDLKSRHENFPCQAELEQQRLEQEQEQKKMELELERQRLEKKEVVLQEQPQKEVKEGSIKFIHLLIVAGIVFIIICVVSIIVFNKYKNYRPIYHVEKMSSPNHNEMTYMKGTLAEKTQLVS